MYIGDQIQQIRKRKKISLVELSQLSGVQLATLSRIENKKMVGTLESHMSIAKALGVDVTDFYRNLKQSYAQEPIQSIPTEIFSKNNASSIEILTKDVLTKKMMPMLIHLKSHAKTQVEQFKAGTERFVFALKGSVVININDRTYQLKSGTSIYFDGSMPHHFINNGKNTITVFCITSPVSL